ncbi:ABC transporter substrate-binding protein [Bacillaceae bacterium]
MKSKMNLVFVALLVLMIIMSGCGGTSQESGKASDSSSQNVAGKETGGDEDEFVIGLSGALTGGSSALGQPQLHAVQLAIEEINNSGGINGAKIRLISEDDQANPTKGVTIAQKFVTKDNVDAFIGPTNSSVALAMAPVFEKAQVPAIMAIPTNDDVTKGKKWIFQIDATSKTQAEFFASYVAKKKMKVGIIHDTTSWGEANKKFAIEELKKLGIEPVAVESLTVGKNDYTPQLLNLKKAGAEILVAGLLGPEAAVVSKNAKQINYTVPIVGPNALAQSSLIELGKKDVEGMVFTSIVDPEKPEFKKFQESFNKKFGYIPETDWAPLGYDAVYILKKAFEVAGHDKEKIREALENLNNYVGVSGKAGSTISFKPDDHTGLKADAVGFLTVKNGRFVKYSEK